MLVIAFPPIDPVIVSYGGIAIRWYALAYLAGFLLGWKYCQWLSNRLPVKKIKTRHYDDFLTWAVVGTVLGGRMGYVMFYQFDLYASDPWEMLKVWHGGMSFHGGMLGVILATVLYTRRKKIPFLAFSDLLACVAPIGLGLGRIANFINGELFGRVTDVPWAVVFPRGGNLPRHPSELYEALLEGLALFLIMAVLATKTHLRERHGLLSGIFLICYGCFRFAVEFFREPDPQLGFIFAGATMGQLLCLPMVVVGGGLVVYVMSRRRRKGGG